MKFNAGTLVLVSFLPSQIVGCSYIKSLFPDKGKDYQYTAEIAPLNLPADLKIKSVAGSSEPKLPEASEKSGATEPENSSAAAGTETQEASADAGSTSKTESEKQAAPVIESVEKYEKVTVELIRYNDGENRLRLGVEVPRAWRLISKALSRNSLEVTNRNQAEGYFVVQYDPNEQKVEDGSLWDEAVFMFRGFSSNEKEYLLRLDQYDRSTEVIVLDKDQQPLSDDGAGLKLLTLLQQTINADLAEKQKE